MPLHLSDIQNRSRTSRFQVPSEKCWFIMPIVYLLPHILSMSPTANTFISAHTSTLISRIYSSLDVPRGKWARSYGRLDRYKNAIKLNCTFRVAFMAYTTCFQYMHVAIDNDRAVMRRHFRSVFPSLWKTI